MDTVLARRQVVAAGALAVAGLGGCGPAARLGRPTASSRAASGELRREGEAQAGDGDADVLDPKEIVTVLPRDAIPAIMNPRFLSAQEAARVYKPDEMVLALNFEGDTRAYSTQLLNHHEIVNDTVGQVPVAITW